MLKIFLILFFVPFMTYAQVNLSSPTVREISFHIEKGIVNSGQADEPEKIIKNQLQYLFGVLNEMDSGIDFPNIIIKVLEINHNNQNYEISYEASGTIAWDRKKETPKTIKFLLPKRGDTEGLTEFLNKYQKNCAKKPASLASFWNYYRPNYTNCPLKGTLPDDLVLLTALLSPRELDDEKREPNYRMIFDDNILEVTAVLTKDNPANEQDASILDFQKLCTFIFKDATTINQLSNECHSEGRKNGQIIKAHIFLINNFNDNPENFLLKISPFILTSDLVTYNGHSGMGTNINSWVKLYSVPQNKYQIVFINSCDTFGYFTNDFFGRYSDINQSENSSDFLDVILNATPNYFGSFANSNQSILMGLLNGNNFKDILSKLPNEQKALLLHE